MAEAAPPRSCKQQVRVLVSAESLATSRISDQTLVPLNVMKAE